MPNAIIHVGASKCGSSALQRALSASSGLSLAGKPAKYVASKANGTLLHDDALHRFAEQNIFGYAAFLGVDQIAGLDQKRKMLVGSRLRALARKYTVILSREGWLTRPELFSSTRILERWGIDAKVVIYVRPPANWINSAWWQWGAWAGRDFDRWLGKALEVPLWHHWVKHWEHVPGVREVEVRLSGTNIVEDFSRAFEVTGLANRYHNQGLSPSILRLYQIDRELRPDSHDSRMDFFISQHLGLRSVSSPWILDRARLERVIEETRDSAERLVTHMRPDQRDEWLSDPRVWDPDAFENKIVESPYCREECLDAREIADVASAALKLAYDLNQKNARLERLNHSLREETWRGRFRSWLGRRGA